MEILFLLIPIAIILVMIIIAVFAWAIKTRQFDDLERHGHDILMDEDSKKEP